MSFFDTKFLLLMLGFVFMAAGAAGITGRWKRWYWTSRRMAFAYLPFGLLFILAAVGQTTGDETIATVLRVVEFAVLAVAIWWVVRPPKFIIPAWIQMIEEHPKTVYELMAASVKAKEEWRSKAETPEALEKWIKATEKQLKNSKR